MIPVLVVGAGPTGLTLACELARHGVACRVVEKSRELFIGSRAKGLQPRTLEVFEDLGVLPAILAGGAPFPPFRLYAGTELRWERTLEEMLGHPSRSASDQTPYPRPWLIPQWRTDRILADCFAELGGRIELGAEVIAIEPSDNGAHVTIRRDDGHETIAARYVVGCDGGRSSVRRLCGFSFGGSTDTLETTLLGDVGVSGLEGNACHILTASGDPTKRFSLWNLPASDHFQFVATTAADMTPALSLEGIQTLLEERTGRTDIRLHDLRWASVHRVSVRMVDELRRGRLLLAGDAAHVHSAAGGQGLNTGVQDAYNLGWKLGAVLHGAGDELLATYEEERLPIAAHVLGMSDWLHRRGFRPIAGGAPAIDQLDIGYRSSSLSFDDRPMKGALVAGDRAPDGRLPDGRRLFDVFRGPHFTLLRFGPTSVSVRVAADPGRLREEHVPSALGGYDVADGTIVIVRPDGYVGAIGSSPTEIETYLARFGLAHRPAAAP